VLSVAIGRGLGWRKVATARLGEDEEEQERQWRYQGFVVERQGASRDFCSVLHRRVTI